MSSRIGAIHSAGTYSPYTTYLVAPVQRCRFFSEWNHEWNLEVENYYFRNETSRLNFFSLIHHIIDSIKVDNFTYIIEIAQIYLISRCNCNALNAYVSIKLYLCNLSRGTRKNFTRRCSYLLPRFLQLPRLWQSLVCVYVSENPVLSVTKTIVHRRPFTLPIISDGHKGRFVLYR